MIKKNNVRPKILNELMAFFENILAPYLDKEFGEVNGRLDKVENRLDSLESELKYVKSDVRDLKADIPTKEEFAVVRKLEKIHRTELAAL